MLLLPVNTFLLHQIVPCDPPASHQPPYLVRHESLRYEGSSTIIPLVGVHFTKWGGCLLARGCCCHSSLMPLTRMFPVTLQHRTSHPTWSDTNQRGVEASSSSYIWWGVNLTEWRGCLLARSCCYPLSHFVFTRLFHVTPRIKPATLPGQT